jgi:aspartate aminotransferase
MGNATASAGRISRRAAGMGESATLGVARRARELAARGLSIVDLGAGEPDFPSPACAVEAARQALADGFTKYTPAAGIPELREALAARFQRDFSAPWQGSDVMVSVGGKGALFELALALFDDGDEVVLTSPYWVSFPEHITFCGARPVFVETRVADGFRIHAEALLEAVTERTRAIIVNSPCNPSGGMISAADLRAVVEGAAERDVVVLSDETYERFVYTDEPFAGAASLAAEFPDTVVVVGSFSKTYAMTGWRLGYALGPPDAIQAALRIQTHATSNPTSFAMVGALAALEHGAADVERMVTEFARRRDLVAAALDEIPGVTCRPPDGAFYAFPRVAECYGAERRGSVAMAEFLLERAGVAVVPGIAFGDDDHVRLSFATSREALREGLSRMAAALSEA